MCSVCVDRDRCSLLVSSPAPAHTHTPAPDIYNVCTRVLYHNVQTPTSSQSPFVVVVEIKHQDRDHDTKHQQNVNTHTHTFARTPNARTRLLWSICVRVCVCVCGASFSAKAPATQPIYHTAAQRRRAREHMRKNRGACLPIRNTARVRALLWHELRPIYCERGHTHTLSHTHRCVQ